MEATFERNSVAYKEDGSQVPVNVPRFEDGGVLIEEGTVNLIPLSDLSDIHGYYPAQGEGIIPPIKQADGYYRLSSIDSAGHTIIEILMNKTYIITEGQTYTESFYFKTDGNMTFNITFFNGTTGHHPMAVTIIDLGNGIKRATATYTTASGDSPIRAIDIQGINWGTSTYIDINYPQLEQKPYATSFVDGTRANESLTIPTANVLNPKEGTIELTYIPKEAPNGYARIFEWGGWTSDRSVDRISIEWDMQTDFNKTHITINICDSTKKQELSYACSIPQLSFNNAYKIKVRYELPGFIKIAVNDLSTGQIYNSSDIADLSWQSIASIALAYIGTDGGGGEWCNGIISDLRISSIARSDEEIVRGDTSWDKWTTCKADFSGSLEYQGIQTAPLKDCICVYDKACKNFDNNGLGVLPDFTKCISDLKMNSDYTLEFEHPLDSRGKWKYLIEGNILKVGGQLYRIYHKKKTLQGITGDARHISYDLLGNFVEDLQITNADGTNALNQLLSHTQYPHSFTAISDVGTLNSIYINRLNPIAAMLGDSGIVKAWGGELERDNFTFRLKQHIGQDRGVTIRQGKNLKGIEEEVNLDNVVTRIFPTGNDNLTLPAGEFVDSPLINNYSEPKIKIIDFSDVDNVDDLRTAAQKMFSEQNVDKPEINITVDFVNLRDTEEYKNYAILETCYFGDTVTVKTDIGIDVKAEVIRIQKNELTGKIEKIELGNFKDDIVDALLNLSDTIQKVDEARLGDRSDLQKAIDDATKQITSALGGYVVKRNGELLIMDTEDINTAVKVWRWNVNGLGYSGTGYNGPYKTAITADGHICADFITTGILSASLIKTGVLQSKNGKIKIDLDAETIDFDKKIVLDANGNLSIDTNAVTSAVRSNTAYLGDLAGLQSQIDGQIMTWFYAGAPTLNNAPANTWTDDTAKIKHLGDLYYDTNNNYAYRFAYINDVYQWNPINDTDVTTALANAAKAQDTADHKKRVFTSTPVPPYDVGDLFSGGSSGDLLRCKTAKTAAQSYDAADWEPATKYTDDTAITNFINNTYNSFVEQTAQKIDSKVSNDTFSTYRQQTATQISEKVSSADMATEIVKNADSVKVAIGQIGGRNLIRNSRGEFGTTNWFLSNDTAGGSIDVVASNVSWNAFQEIAFKLYNPGTSANSLTQREIWVKENTTYTLSFKSYTNSPNGSAALVIGSNADDMAYTHVHCLLSGLRDTSPTSYKVTFTTAADECCLFLRFDNNGGGNSFFTEIKLEEGSNATAWCSAANELKSATFEFTADGFTLKNSNGETILTPTEIDCDKIVVKNFKGENIVGGTISGVTVNVSGTLTSTASFSGGLTKQAILKDGETYYYRSTGGHGEITINIDDSLMFYSQTNGFVFEGTNNVYNSSVACGSVVCYGSKPALVDTENYSKQHLFSEESPEVVFRDRGHGIIGSDGTCIVFFDDIFAETVTTTQSDYYVQLTGYKGCNVEIQEKYPDYFIVSGNPGKEFDWEVICSRKGYERLRFNDVMGVNI